jgi:hypothetical protein
VRRRWTEGVLVKRRPFTIAEAREQGYRRALEHAGYTPGSVEIAVKRDRDWIDRGEGG